MELKNLPKIRVSIKERSFLNKIPSEPGIYQFHNQANEIIYIGKAKNIKKRMASYFNNTSKDKKTSVLVKQIRHIDCIITLNELEAFILESNLIKKEKPKYNIRLKDSKQYPIIKVTVNETYPRVLKTREFKQDKSRYFGPYPSGSKVNEILKLISKWFRIRSCTFDLPSKQTIKPCLDYHIKRCDGCCIDAISPEDYRKKYIAPVLLLLSGHYDQLTSELEKKMKSFAAQLNFIEANKIKKQIEAIQSMASKQYVYSTKKINLDIFNVSQQNKINRCYLSVLMIRNGMLLGKRQFLIKTEDNLLCALDESKTLMECIQNYYQGTINDIPDKILVPIKLNDSNLLEQILSQQKSSSVRVIDTLGSEEKREWIRLANLNMNQALPMANKEEKRTTAINELKHILNLKALPKRIEGFDIANILGQQSVAAMVCFEEGKPVKSEYRHFKIQSVDGPNDFASIQEAVARRYQRCINESLPLPNLIVIDGAKGQIKYAQQALIALSLSIPIIGLAKKQEIIFQLNKKEGIKLPIESKALQLLQHIRDEAHRFGNQFHRRWRNKESLKSVLDEIKGIGPKRKQMLLKHFATIQDVQNASLEEIEQIPSLSKAIAEKIYNHFLE